MQIYDAFIVIGQQGVRAKETCSNVDFNHGN